MLVGDPCQLPEIDAGGAFRGLRARLDASDLTDNRRQTDAWEHDALAQLRAGDPDRAVDAYLEHDRVHHAGSDREVRELLVEEWMNARCFDDLDALMVAARLADVDDLNRRARQALRAEGYRGDDQVVLAGRGYTEGDDVLALRNEYRLGVLNGTRAVVERVDTRQQQMTLGTDDGRRLVVPFAYAEAGHLTHGYATTIHKAQGVTVDRCLVLLDDTTSREHAYTALSRGRHGNDLFVVTDDHRVGERHAVEIQPDPLEDLRRAIRHSAGKRMALDDMDNRRPRRSASSGASVRCSGAISATARPTHPGSTAGSPRNSPWRRSTEKGRSGGSTRPARNYATSARLADARIAASGASWSVEPTASRPTSTDTRRGSPISKVSSASSRPRCSRVRTGSVSTALSWNALARWNDRSS